MNLALKPTRAITSMLAICAELSDDPDEDADDRDLCKRLFDRFCLDLCSPLSVPEFAAWMTGRSIPC